MADTERIIEKITKARRRLLDAVAGLSEQQMAWSPAGEWSTREILHHVAIGEETNVELAKRALSGNPVTIEDFDLDTWNVEQVAQHAGQPASDAIDRLHRVRQETLDTLQSLSDDDLAASLDHPGWGEMTLQQLFRALGTHDLMHRRDILKRIDQCRELEKPGF